MNKKILKYKMFFQEIVVSLFLLQLCLALPFADSSERAVHHGGLHNGHQGPYAYQTHYGHQTGHYGHQGEHGHQTGHYGHQTAHPAHHTGHYEHQTGHHGQQTGHYGQQGEHYGLQSGHVVHHAGGHHVYPASTAHYGYGL